jgi:NitT/TauT family transport system permease protein
MTSNRTIRNPLGESAGVLTIQIGLVLILLAVWEVSVRLGVVNAFYVGQPSKVFAYFDAKLKDGTLASATWVTFSESLTGFVLGTAIGTTIGLGLWWSRTLTALVRPLLVALNAVPKLTFAPVFILVLGLGFELKVVMSFAGVVIVALLSAYVGARQADADLIDLIRSVGGSRWQVFVMIILPSALPWVIVSMEINIGLALVGAVVGEFLASDQGLGHLAVYGAGTFDMSLVLVAVTTLVGLATLMYGAVRLFEAWVLPVRPESVQAAR